MDEQQQQNETNGASGGTALQWPDYLILGIVLSISAVIGIYYRFTGGKQRTTEEYFSANRSMKIVPLAIALMVSFMSAISLLGISADAYTYGASFLLVYVGFGIGTPITMYLYLPVFFRLNVMSVFEYLQRRFGVKARLMASLVNFLHLMFYTGIVLYAPSLALEATTGISVNMSIVMIGAICTFYSTIGGIKAVLITDVFQGILMFASIIAVICIGTSDLEGGLSEVWSASLRSGRLKLSDFSFDLTTRYTWWNLVIGGCTVFLSLFAVNQVQVQRLLTVKSLKASRIALALNWILMFSLASITVFSGLVLYAVYQHCDPVQSGEISTNDKMMPFFAVKKMSRIPGLVGLFVAGIFSASLSTISAMLNSLAVVTIEDYIKPIYSKYGSTFPDDKATLVGKALAIVNGISCILLALIAGKFGSLVQAVVALMGTFGGPLLGIFTLGMFFEYANEIGALVGMNFGLSFCIFLVVQAQKSHHELPTSVDGCEGTTVSVANYTTAFNSTSSYEENGWLLKRISYMWYAPIGFASTLIFGYLASLIARKVFRDTRQRDAALFTPFVAARIRRRRRDAERTRSSQVFVLEPTK